MDNSITILNYKRSRRNMGVMLNRLYNQRGRFAEGDPMIDKINHKIELLRMIRSEMKTLINALS